MKKFTTIAFTCTALLLVSCNNFLDIVPTGRVIPKNYDEYKALLINAYSLVPEDRGLASFRSDEVELSDKVALDVAAYRDIFLWNDNAGDASTAEFNWKNYYHVIFLANHIIVEQNSISEGTPAEVSQLVGEAYMLRAYSHFLLVNLFAKPYDEATASSTPGIPIKTTVSMDEVPVKKSVKEVYEQILTDITEAEARLKIQKWDTQYSFRFSLQAASAFKARVLLYMNRWDDAAAASTQTIGMVGKLVDLNVSTKVLPTQVGSEENIMALEQVFTSSTVGAAGVPLSLINLYNKDDKRKQAYFKAVTLEIYQVVKKGGEDYRCSFRLGEQYLIAAEAYTQSGNLDEGKHQLLNLLKTRLSKSYFTTDSAKIVTFMKDDFLAEVAVERQRELCFEGHRWFDLRRTNQPRIERVFNGATYVLLANDARYTIPIPKEAVENNPNLGSN